MTEIWKDIPGYEGLYQASTEGRIKSLSRSSFKKKGHYIAHEVKVREKILKGRPQRHGYLAVALFNNTSRKDISVHRLIAKTFCENPDNKPHVNHIDGNKTNNHSYNLEWCTHKENINHAWKIGKCKPKQGDLGEKSPHAKLTEEQVIEMRNLYAAGGYSHQYFADKFKMSRRHIGDIINKVCWPHI